MLGTRELQEDQEFPNSSLSQNLTQFIRKKARSTGDNHLLVHTKRGSNNIIP